MIKETSTLQRTFSEVGLGWGYIRYSRYPDPQISAIRAYRRIRYTYCEPRYKMAKRAVWRGVIHHKQSVYVDFRKTRYINYPEVMSL